MDLRGLQTALMRYGFDSSDPLDIWLQAAANQFVDSYPWPFLERVGFVDFLGGALWQDLTRDLPTFRRIYSVTIYDSGSSDYEKLVYWDPHRFDMDLENPIKAGTPELYTLVDLKNLYLWPQPASTLRLQVRYYGTGPDLEGHYASNPDTQITEIPHEYHFTVVRAAAVIALQTENEEDRAVVAQSAYEADLQRAIEFYSRNQEDDPESVVDVQGYSHG